MYIDEGVLKGHLDESSNKFEQLSKGRIFKRFSYTQSVFEGMQGIEIDFTDLPVVDKWENGGIKNFKKDKIERGIFSPCHIGLTDDKRYGGILLQKKYFENDKFENTIIQGGEKLSPEKRGEFVKGVLSIIGGFDSRGKMKDEYRILSNAQTSTDDFTCTLQSNGQYAWINSHFADNTLFCEFVKFVKFVKECKGEQGVNNEWYKNIALCYPYADDAKKIGKLSNASEKIEEQEKKKQQEILPYRFPLKFLWMWAKRDSVIHPLSLMAFREFLKSDFMSEIFTELSSDEEFCKIEYVKDLKMGNNPSKYAEQITNAHIEFFPELWEEVSGAIMEKLCVKDIEKVSKLISLLTLGDTNMTNIDELLKTHKQIILYGVPGTGKTHSAKELIREWGKTPQKQKGEEVKQEKIQQGSEDDLKQWHFSRFVEEQNQGENFPIVWEIMQFHPNTTYQDFIGGIIPQTEDGKLTYKVKDGKFKKFCECARENSNTKFVFIIDEINRANLSEVLGELLYALEYRDEEITIPNFDEPFVIPSNVYIIGTMNNVDKSLSTFDLALRRRFGFYEIGVDCDVIEKMLKAKTKEDILDKYVERCQDLNALISNDFDEESKERLSKEEKNALGFEKHYKIGQAYFAKIEKFFENNKDNAITPIHLTKLWDYHLQPLIEEYIGFSMDDQEVSKKLDGLKTFWIEPLCVRD